MWSYDLYRGSVEDGIGITYTIVAYNVAERCRQQVGVDSPGIIRTVDRARVTAVPCQDINTVDVLQYPHYAYVI